jgi:integrase
VPLSQSLVDRISGAQLQSWEAWLNKYEALLAARALKPNTRRTYKSLLGRARATFPGQIPVAQIGTRAAADAIDALIAAGHARMAQLFRAFLSDCFREAIAQGWISKSPMDVTRAVTVTVKRSRLSLEVFQAVYRADIPVWLRNAMALAIVSGQRREDISGAMFRDFKEGAWWVDQGKTGARLILPMALRLDAVGLSLEDVQRQCRATGVLSPYLIHQVRNYGNSPAGEQIWIDTITRRFSDAVVSLGASWGEKNPPTFHEIRSLSERLYKAQGNVNTQELLGHRDPRTTATYHDARGEWVRVAVGGAQP